MLRLLVLLGLLGILLAVPSLAMAHGDDALADSSFQLRPGESKTFEGEVHYHRLIAHIVADTMVDVRLLDDDGATVLETGPASELEINELIPCCDDRAWTPHTLIIENPASATATVAVHAGLVHDDLAVMVYTAESGTVESVFVMGGLWIAILWRITRRWPESVTAGRAITSLAVVVGAVLILAVYGSTRYGVGSAPGLVGGLADLPVLPRNPIVSRASLLLGGAMVGWAVAGARWAKARPAMHRSLWLVLGTVVAGAVIATGLLIASAYDATAMPLAMTLTAVIPVSVVALRGWSYEPLHVGAPTRAENPT